MASCVWWWRRIQHRRAAEVRRAQSGVVPVPRPRHKVPVAAIRGGVFVNISATVINASGKHSAVVRTEDQERAVTIAPKAEGFGSSINGGELLFLALATCYCNDVYREAKKAGVSVDGVEVSVTGKFDDQGTARDVRYHVKIKSAAPSGAIDDLVKRVDEIAEVHRALRLPMPVEFAGYEIVAT